MKFNKETGLVPVKVIAPHPSGSVMIGDIIGISPDRAQAYLDLKIVELVDIPSGIETANVGEAESPAPIEPESAPETETDWRKMRHMSKLKFAKEFGYTGENNGEAINAYLEALDSTPLAPQDAPVEPVAEEVPDQATEESVVEDAPVVASEDQ